MASIARCSSWPPTRASSWRRRAPSPFALVAGVIGDTRQAVAEAEIAARSATTSRCWRSARLRDATDDAAHRALPRGGGGDAAVRLLPAARGRRARAELRVLARVRRDRATCGRSRSRRSTATRRWTWCARSRDAGRDDIALYTGNDDSIIVDLLTPFPRSRRRQPRAHRRRAAGPVGGVDAAAVRLLAARSRGARRRRSRCDWLRDAAALTDANGAIFDAANGFAGCIPGIHEVLRRQGLLRGTWCLDPSEALSPGQAEEIDRVCRAYPELNDDVFVAENLDRWLA